MSILGFFSSVRDEDDSDPISLDSYSDSNDVAISDSVSDEVDGSRISSRNCSSYLSFLPLATISFVNCDLKPLATIVDRESRFGRLLTAPLDCFLPSPPV